MSDQPHGRSGEHSGLSQADAETAIVKAGFQNPTSLKQRGHSWHGTANDSTGATVNVVVDGHGGVHLDDDSGDVEGA